MKIWLLKTSREDYYILIKVPGKEEYIEVNIQVLKDIEWKKRRNKRINLKTIFCNLPHLPPDCHFYKYFPRGYNRALVYSKQIIYFQDIEKIGESYWWEEWTKLW